MEKNSHCSYCGTKYGSIPYSTVTWPRYCYNCANTTWRNPLPVTVALCSVIGPVNERGLVVIRRSIEPHIGEWALPGGYLDYGETWQEGTVRELFEETGMKVSQERILSNSCQLITAPSNSNLLIFSTVWVSIDELPTKFIPNSEVSEMKVVYEPMKLAFPTHTEMMQKFFQRD